MQCELEDGLEDVMGRIEDLLYFETDDSCALCGQRGAHNLTVHHINCDEKDNSYDSTYAKENLFWISA